MPARDDDTLATAPHGKPAPDAGQVDADTPGTLETYDQQVNVRFKPRRVNQARRLAASRGESMQQFFDRLVLAEVAREQEILLKEFEEEERRAREARENLRRELEELAST